MQFRTAVVLISALVSLCLVSSTNGAEGLSCWVCSSILDPACNDTAVPDEPTKTILKSDCNDIPSPALGGPVRRTVPATSCLKNTLTVNAVTIVTRGCASPGDLGIEDATTETCTTLKTPDGRGSSRTCLCKGDFCNGSESLKISTAGRIKATFIPLVAILLSRIFSA